MMRRLPTALLVVLAVTVSITAFVVMPSGRAAPGEVRFTAVGDFGQGAATGAVLSSIGAMNRDLTLALGDLSYGVTGQEESWCDFVKARVPSGHAFELLAGNHESNGQNGNINDFSACLPNQLPGLAGTYGRQYVADVPRGAPMVRFIAISPGLTFPGGTWSYAAGSPRYQWTAAAIDEARAAGIPWVVVAMHFPCLTSGEKTCEGGADIANLLVSKKVDLVLTGHEHNYQRTKQLALGASCPALVPNTYTAACVVDAGSALVKGAGTSFVTVGTGGIEHVATNPADAEAPYFAAASGTNFTDGALDVVADADRLSATFVRAGDGSFADAFTISRGPVPTSTATPTPTPTQTPTPTPTVAPALLADTFSRTIAAGWGSAETGGPWTTSLASGVTASVNGAAGTLTLPGGRSATVTSPTMLGTRPDVTIGWSLDKPASGSGLYVSVMARRVSGQGEYRAKVRHNANGSVSLALVRTSASGVETVVSPEAVVPGLTVGAGERVRLRVQALDASPTTVRARLWKTGAAEPSTWLATATDSTAGLQASGSFGLYAYVSSGATTVPVTVAVDDVMVTSAP